VTKFLKEGLKFMRNPAESMGALICIQVAREGRLKPADACVVVKVCIS
jgi:hypothetical protein